MTSEETIDVLDLNGTPTGARKPKSQIHRDGDWHRAAHVWIVSPDRKVLLQRRSPKKLNYPDLWDVSVAGHVSAGETAVEAAIRETQEEIGLALRPDELTWIGALRQSSTLRNGTYIDNEIYLVRREIELGQLIPQPDEVADLQIVCVEDLERRMRDGDPMMVPHPGEYLLLMNSL
ncbi:MAG TPA: NUDIX domain-containing protein [Thermoanaerobaculia bacterium]|nr:NUDIX domain-containing protein [Thermoanaerobaculia bacterium]